jgi:hypothetical protein
VALDVEPVGDMIELKILDDIDDDEESKQATAATLDDSNGVLLAIVGGVGKNVTNCKKGDTVLCRPYAKNGIRLDDSGENVLVESCVVVAKVLG